MLRGELRLGEERRCLRTAFFHVLRFLLTGCGHGLKHDLPRFHKKQFTVSDRLFLKSEVVESPERQGSGKHSF